MFLQPDKESGTIRVTKQGYPDGMDMVLSQVTSTKWFSGEQFACRKADSKTNPDIFRAWIYAKCWN